MMSNTEIERWSIFIDIEGFSFLHKTSEPEAHRRLNNLIEDIYIIGTRVYPEDPDRLFVHQLGDGFVIVSSYPGENLFRPVSIALALMQSALLKGGICKVGISEGNFADVQGMWPKEIRDNVNECASLRLGEGIMNLFTVMGNALINSHKVLANAGSGPIFAIDRRLEGIVHDPIKVHQTTEKILYVNWLLSNTDLSNDLLVALGHPESSMSQLRILLEAYINDNDITKEWRLSAQNLLDSCN